MKKTYPILLSAVLLLTACAQTAETAAATAETAHTVTAQAAAEEKQKSPKTTPNGVDKAETVYAKAAADGTVTETTVEVTLKAQDGDSIEDVSTLHNILNKEGDEEYTAGENGALCWQNSGSAITYEGKTEAELPVTTRVTYYLNGEEIAPEKLAGQSGRVKIRFDYTNHTRQSVTVDGTGYMVSVPFTAITALMLDDDTFTNIETENGKVLELDGQTIVMGTAMPGLADSLLLSEFEPLEDTEIPDYFEVTADVTDFALDFTATVLTPSTLEDLDDADLQDLDDLSDTLNDLTDAADELTDGTGALADGVMELYNGFSEYAAGVEGLNTGAEALYDGVNQLYENGQALVSGADALRDGLSQVSLAVSTMVDGAASGTGDTAETQQKMMEQLTPIVSDYGTNVVTDVCSNQDLAAALVAAGVQPEQLQTVLGAVGAAVGSSLNSRTAPMLQQAAGTVTGALTGSFGELKTGLEQLASGSAELARGADTYVKAVGQVNYGAKQLADGSAQLDDASDAMNGGIAELHNGAEELHNGVKEFSDESKDKLADGAGNGLRNVVRRLKATRQAGEDYQNFSGLADGKTGNVKFVIETAEIK